MKISLKLIFKALLIFLAAWVILLIVSTHVSDILFDFKLTKYNNEIDSIFNKQAINKLNVRYMYRSGNRGTIFFTSIDSSYLTIIEATNFKNIFPYKLNSEIIEKTDLTDLKTYTTIFHDNFPVIQAILNPRKSEFLRILLEQPYEIMEKERKGNHFYLSGKFRSIALSNSQHCYIISIGDQQQELLILNYRNKLYILNRKLNKTNLIDLIRPDIL